MQVLVLGGGGREHAIVLSLVKSPQVDKVFVAPGNGGTARIATNVELDIENGLAVAAFAKAHDVGLVVVGPEAPLVAGVADAVRAEDILCFGPGAMGAQIEGSKAFSKDLMRAYDIPTANYRVFTNKKEARDYLDDVGVPIVVKADGLAAGKGVIVALDEDDALHAIESCFDGTFGQAGDKVVIEEYLTGPEVSFMVFTDGRSVIPMMTAQDHKRAFDGDEGPNTGGMGVYSPVPVVSGEEQLIMFEIMERTVQALRTEGIDYRGVLYGGFILTKDGPKVLEFNARFGDPETQVVLPRLKSDLFEALAATAAGTLDEIELTWRDQWAVSVVMASGGYPAGYRTDLPISGIDEAGALDGVIIYHAGTTLTEHGQFLTSGGRVLDVTALGEDFAHARELAYKAVSRIDFEDAFFRTDIGAKAVLGREAWSE